MTYQLKVEIQKRFRPVNSEQFFYRCGKSEGMAAKALKLRAEVTIMSNHDLAINHDIVNSIKAIDDWSFIVKVTYKQSWLSIP